MNMIRVTIKEDNIKKIVSIPYDERCFDQSRANSYSWITSGTVHGVDYVADHYADDCLEILFKTESITTALLKTLDVHNAIMNVNENDNHSIINL